MKRSAILLALIVATNASAATNNAAPAGKPETDTARQSLAQASNTSGEGVLSGARLGIKPSYSLVNSNSGYGATLEFQVAPIKDLPIFVGLESGFIHTPLADLPGVGGVTTQYTNSIPIQATATYRVDLADSSIKPYAGISAGVSLNNTQANFEPVGGASVDLGSNNRTVFEGFVRPGIEVANFLVEPRFGLIDDQFIFLPTIGYYIVF